MSGRHRRHGGGFQVQNRLRQASQGVSLTSFMDDAGGADQTAADGVEPRLLEGATQERQGAGRGRMGAGLEFPGVGVIAPEALSQDQIPDCQPRGQGTGEPKRDQEPGPAVAYQGFPGPARRRLAHPGQGHNPRPRLPFPGRHSQVPAGSRLYLAQKRPHFQG